VTGADDHIPLSLTPLIIAVLVRMKESFKPNGFAMRAVGDNRLGGGPRCEEATMMKSEVNRVEQVGLRPGDKCLRFKRCYSTVAIRKYWLLGRYHNHGHGHCDCQYVNSKAAQLRRFSSRCGNKQIIILLPQSSSWFGSITITIISQWHRHHSCSRGQVGLQEASRRHFSLVLNRHGMLSMLLDRALVRAEVDL
jgi:hypothetical protein